MLVFLGKAVVVLVAAYAAGALFWRAPEVIVDASRYFAEAKYLEVHGLSAFLAEWGRAIPAWTDLPLVPLLYGLAFRVLGESRIWIQALTTLLFAGTVVLTHRLGKPLWDEEVGLTAGALLLSMPYLLTQVPGMLVDVPTMFFVLLAVVAVEEAFRRGGPGRILLASLAVAQAFFSKYSAWLLLTVLPVIGLVHRKGPRPLRTGLGVALVTAALVLSAALPRLDVSPRSFSLAARYTASNRMVPRGFEAVGTGPDAPATNGVDVLGWDFAFELNELARQHTPTVLADGQQAVSIVRQRASEWGIAPDRIGMMGFSAGAFLTVITTLQADRQNRPDFAASIYGALWENLETSNPLPPLSIALTDDDALTVEPSLQLYSAWHKANCPVEMHIYARGGHGFAMRHMNPATEAWIERLAGFMVDGLLAAGFPRCPGGYMATAWHDPIGQWEQRLTGWIAVPRGSERRTERVIASLPPIPRKATRTPGRTRNASTSAVRPRRLI